ncbi:hypothetical protein DEU34_0553 [Microbacterium sp. AG1240]|uniref:hypothetical protein n=1 Tax=Microbacterium sp. AG1240 TaxID=2183992 RepID=UPI000F0E73E8|nr:hypothetical protein [Microbacterium sp. AG1240]RKT36047.1 hypothetical protein DEU34_0553 [Microbacterium sp. AG1240]
MVVHLLLLLSLYVVIAGGVALVFGRAAASADRRQETENLEREERLRAERPAVT